MYRIDRTANRICKLPAARFADFQFTRRWNLTRRMALGSRRQVVIAGALLFVIAPERSARADRWSLPEQISVTSANGSWSASVTPSGEDAKEPRITVAPVSRPQSTDGWTRSLVNRTAPVEVVVSDKGAVVTLGEWHSNGYEHSIVMYDRWGNVVVDYRLEDFLTDDELKRVQRSMSSRWWTYSGESPEFADNEFVLTTLWGTALRFDLRTGRVSRDEDLFGRFQRYCTGARRSSDVLILMSWPPANADRRMRRNCEVRRTGALCWQGPRWSRVPRDATEVVVDPHKFDRLRMDAVVLAPLLAGSGSRLERPSDVFIELRFGERPPGRKSGMRIDGDAYSMAQDPAEATSPAREWTEKVTKLLGAW